MDMIEFFEKFVSKDVPHDLRWYTLYYFILHLLFRIFEPVIDYFLQKAKRWCRRAYSFSGVKKKFV